ncbi:Mu transposase C-terminal domain-containing protein [Neisseria sp. Ec49-e6-T10]|uniref:Mu transposase C-terminal domain-containing protein n=1 Tax=Neisseria sp. Ec49-e6-T10 TaxID=3140744 RepID=UPI003EBB78C0
MNKVYFSVADLVDMGLKCLPTTRRRILEKTKNENWPFIEKTGKGGKRKEYAPPAYVLDEINQKQAIKVIKETSTELTTVENNFPTLAVDQTLSSVQAIKEGARKGVLAAIRRLMVTTNCSKEAAIQTLLVQAQLPGNEQVKATFLNACDSRGSTEDKLPSIRTIKRWFAQDTCNNLAPKVRKADMNIPEWARLFLSIWQTPQKPTVSSSYEDFCKMYQGEAPSIHAVRRFLKKLGNVTREHGRMGPRELKNIKPFVRRKFEHLLPTDIYTADGHTFDAEVAHPIHGRPWRPEITTVADVATRKIVGWSVDLAESALAVLAAVTHAVETNGIPAIFYVDNGPGYDNALMSDVSIGIMGRLGTEMTNSIPYNSQSRGVIERLHQTVFVKAAKKLPTYMGKDMDQEAKQFVFKHTRKDIVAPSNKKPLLPTYEQFLKLCEEVVEEYNNRPHRSLPKIVDNTGTRRHMTPSEMWALKVENGAEIITVTPDQSTYLFRPQIQRKVLRGEIRFINRRYFNKDLEEFHGEIVNVAFDIHNGEQIWVYNDIGILICTAQADANAQNYMPESYVQSKRDKRAQGRERRLENKLAEVRAEHKGQPLIEHQASLSMAGMNIDMAQVQQLGAAALERITVPTKTNQSNTISQPVIKQEPVINHEFVVPTDPMARYQQYLISVDRFNNGEDLSEFEKNWIKRYPDSNEFRAMSKKVAGL